MKISVNKAILAVLSKTRGSYNVYFLIRNRIISDIKVSPFWAIKESFRV